MENAVATGMERSRFGMVAAPVHTVVVLALLAVGDYLGAIRSGQLRAAASVDRVALYGRTIFLELLMLGVVLLGVWLHGIPFASVLGERWRSGREVLRDVGIALAFWVGLRWWFRYWEGTSTVVVRTARCSFYCRRRSRKISYGLYFRSQQEFAKRPCIEATCSGSSWR
jgi:hypothetical protein